MIKRYLSAVLTAFAVTTSLIWVMHTLVEVSEAALVETDERERLTLGRTVVDTPTNVIAEPPIPPRPPVNPPPLIPPTNSNEPTAPVSYPNPGPATPPSFSGPDFFGHGDSTLVNIINAQPDYPISASQKGLEGYVVVQFDVTAAGAVENVIVVEKTSSIFNKSATKAAYRSRYKPRSIDGVPQKSFGLRKLFRFEMEN